MSDVLKFLKFLELLGYEEMRLPEGALKDDSPAEKLKELEEKVKNCKACRLYKSRSNVVFGYGNPNARLMFVGEAPGEQEDKQGKPFVGRAGQLLSKYLNAFGISRDSVYIANVLKCRPPNNRDPAPDEIRSCFPYLKAQIEIIHPKVILCLGAFAARTILNLPEKTPLSRIRGKEEKLGDITVIATYHPAYLLRNRRGELDFQRDLERALRLSGLI